jgi:SET domain-containing protein
VYARTCIPDGTRIIEYTGERITKAEARRREERRLSAQRRGAAGCVTIFELNQRFDLDGRNARTVAPFINHSCAPNCRTEPIRGHIWIIARRDIAVGEELTFDYGYGFKDWSLHPCRCGASRCVGYIVGSAQRWRVRRILRGARRATQ